MAQIGIPTFFPPKSPLSLEKMGLLPSAFSLLWGSAFGATAHDAAHGAFMTLPHHTRTKEGEVHQLGSGPNVLRAGLCVMKCSLI
jgi:hypothetical protein